MTHSVDAYILRAMHRRCNYDSDMVEEVARVIEVEGIRRQLSMPTTAEALTGQAKYYVAQYTRSSLADVVILPYLNGDTVQHLSTPHLKALAEIVEGMLSYIPFELVTIHDEFKAHANNINHVRYQYKEILAEIADSNVLDDLLSQINGVTGKFNKPVSNLGDLIRQSNYALC